MYIVYLCTFKSYEESLLILNLSRLFKSEACKWWGFVHGSCKGSHECAYVNQKEGLEFVLIHDL